MKKAVENKSVKEYNGFNMIISKEGNVPFPIVEGTIPPEEFLARLGGDPKQIDHALSGLSKKAKDPIPKTKLFL